MSKFTKRNARKVEN